MNKKRPVDGTKFLWEMAKFLGAPIRAGMWAMARPQQAIFQAARKGADSFARHLAQPGRAGQENSAWQALKKSGSDFAQGFKEGLTGRGKDVLGRDLVEGVSDNRWVEKGVGLGLDLFADPTLALGGVTAKPASKALRTFQNLRNLGPQKRALLRKLGAQRYLLDVPAAPYNYRYPLLIKTKKDPSRLYQKMFGEVPKGGPNVQSWTRDGITVVQDKHLASELPKALAEHAVNRTKGQQARFLDKDFERLVAQNPVHAKALRKNPHYAHLSDAELGREIFARATAAGKNFRSPRFVRLQEEASEILDPRVFSEPKAYPWLPLLMRSPRLFNPEARRDRRRPRQRRQSQWTPYQ